jgi:XRE family transcriptional regulator, aerobic/anaerobic benzoate catabolism transcriptional regulator
MADHPQAMADLRSLLASREPLYAMADHIIDTAELSADAVVRRIEPLVTAATR